MKRVLSSVRNLGLLGWLAMAACSVTPEEGLLDAEYQYHRVGNRKATVEELKEMQRREETHIVQLQAEIDLLQQHEIELATEREARDASLHLLAKDVETAKRRVDACKADLESALVARSTLEHERDLLTAEIGKMRADVAALSALLQHIDQRLAPDRVRLSELLEQVGKDLDQSAGTPAPQKPTKSKQD